MDFRVLPTVPEYELSSYEPVTIKRNTYTVTDDMVETKVKELMAQAPKDVEETSRKVAGPKDLIKIAIHVDRDGKDIEALCADEQYFVLGSGSMPIGFDRAVVGIAVGEEREFDFNAPNLDEPASKEEVSYHAKVKLHAVMREVDPVLTDEWVSNKILLCKTVEDFYERTRKQLEKEAKSMEEADLVEQAAVAVAARFEGHIDDIWYEQTQEDLTRSYEEQAKAMGMSLEDMVASQGMNKETFNMMVMMQVRDMLKQGFSLDSWARHYGLEATEDDVVYVADLMSEGRGKLMIDSLKESGDEEQLKGLRMAALRYVANKDVLDKATVE